MSELRLKSTFVPFCRGGLVFKDQDAWTLAESDELASSAAIALLLEPIVVIEIHTGAGKWMRLDMNQRQAIAEASEVRVRDGAEAARLAHNQEAGGSSPSPAPSSETLDGEPGEAVVRRSATAAKPARARRPAKRKST